MPDYINYNGEILPAEQPIIASGNRSFQFGDGIFETIKISNGKILFINDHFNRLKKGVSFLQISLPEYFDISFFEQQILETIETNAITQNARIKVTVFRGGNGKYEPETNEAHWIINTSALYRPDYQWHENGLHLGLFNRIQKTCDDSSNLKTTGSLVYVMAALHKKESGFDESIILNTKENVADAVYANVFMIQGNRLITPALDEGCIDGVMRKQVLKIARYNGFKTNEGAFTPEQLASADEIFLTNSIKGIVWVKHFSGKDYPCKISSDLMEKLNEAIKDY